MQLVQATMDPTQIYVEVVQFYPSKQAYLDNATKIRGRMAQLMGMCDRPGPENVRSTQQKAWLSLYYSARREQQAKKMQEKEQALQRAKVDYMYAAVANIYTLSHRLPR